jgi:hypothetical protein
VRERRVGLSTGRVDARRRGVEVPHARRGFEEQVSVDEHAQHALGLVRLDVANAAHVCGEVVHHVEVVGLHHVTGLFSTPKVHLVNGDSMVLPPLVPRLDVHAHHLMAVVVQALH